MNRVLDKKKLLGLLGFAARARKLQTGTEIVTTSIRKHAAHPASRSKKGRCGIVLVAADASDNTVKRITSCAEHYHIPLVHLPIPKSELSHLIGKMSDVAVCGVFDPGFAEAIYRLVEGIEQANNADTIEKNAQAQAPSQEVRNYDYKQI